MARPDMLSSALQWLFPKQKFVLELQVTQSQAIAYLRDRVRGRSLSASSLFTDFDGIAGHIDGQEIVLQCHRNGQLNGDAQEFRGLFVTDGARRYIVGEFAQPREFRVVTLVQVALLAVSGLVLLALGASQGSVKGAAAAVLPALMLAVVLSRARAEGWAALGDIPVVERLLREAASERVV
jgi:hypothetical protein